MPFTKKAKKEESFPVALGLTEERADQLVDEVREITKHSTKKSDVLLALNEKYDDRELLLASFIYGQYVGLSTDPIARILENILNK